MKGVEQWFWMIFGTIAALFLLASFARMYAGIAEEHRIKGNVQEFEKIASSLSILCAAPPESSDEVTAMFSDDVFAVYVSPDESKPPVDARRLYSSGKRTEGNYFCIQLRPVNERRPICRELCRINMSYIVMPDKETVFSRAMKLLGKQNRFEWKIHAERLAGKINATVCMRGEGC